MYYRTFHQLRLWLWGTTDVPNDKWNRNWIMPSYPTWTTLQISVVSFNAVNLAGLCRSTAVWLSTENAYREQEPAGLFPKYLPNTWIPKYLVYILNISWLVDQLLCCLSFSQLFFRCKTRGNSSITPEEVIKLSWKYFLVRTCFKSTSVEKICRCNKSKNMICLCFIWNKGNKVEMRTKLKGAIKNELFKRQIVWT